MQDKTKKLIARMQVREDADRLRRARRIVRAIKGIGHHFRDHELNEMEGVVEGAYGRARLNGR